MSIRNLQKPFVDFKSFLWHLNLTFRVICLSEKWFHYAKYQQNGLAGGGVCIFIYETVRKKKTRKTKKILSSAYRPPILV